MQAILSTANSDGIVELARELATHNVTLFATGETQKTLRQDGIMVEAVSALTGFPEILEGRVRTLHPAIFGGILALRENTDHLNQLQEHGLAPIDMVVNNLYPFVETVSRSVSRFGEALEQIDIGGVSLIRAAAKNFKDVIVLVRPQDYRLVMREWSETGSVSLGTRRRLAVIAFQYIASYDAAIADFLARQGEKPDRFPEMLTVSLERIQNLRYGENPHQQAAFYRVKNRSDSTLHTIADAEVLHGKELSFNDLLDLDAALATVNSFTAPAIAIIKHTNPCGLACDNVLVEAYKKAHAGDPVSAYGGIIGSNRMVGEDTASEIVQLFYEAIIAPGYTPEALDILRGKTNLRILATHAAPDTEATHAARTWQIDARSISGGLLLQTVDEVGEHELNAKVMTEREPTLGEVTDLMFAWKAVRHAKSNAIVLARNLSLVGVGAGQANRVTSVQIAVERAAERARGSVLASDAYFPFDDGVETAAKAGITAIIQPGGSIRDKDAIAAIKAPAALNT
jgi:phosphoribosylaminoimidazolecarboxamide formyltransferase/IMP cyclohydrolase